jgi:hypothetical protein
MQVTCLVKQDALILAWARCYGTSATAQARDAGQQMLELHYTAADAIAFAIAFYTTMLLGVVPSPHLDGISLVQLEWHPSWLLSQCTGPHNSSRDT